jgi:hypothetical protein
VRTNTPNRSPSKPAVACLLLLSLSSPTAAATLEDELNARWRGGWVLVRAAVSSDCAGFYTDNDVAGTRVQTRGTHDFAPGELARVDRVDARRGGRVDVFLDVAEQVLEAHRDGPFTLYEPKSCKLQLKLANAGVGGTAAAERALAALLELHADARAAEASPGWNGRRREPFPAGYERTLAEHASWKAAQVNTAVRERLDRAIDEAARTNDRMRSDPDYLAGFAAGVERARDRTFGDCPSLVGASFYPDSARDESELYEDGYEDGQRLAFALELMKRLTRCFVPVPAVE